MYWAAEIRSAEATELPVWKRPPVSVANGLCHPNVLDPGSSGSRRFSRIKGADERGLGLWGGLLWGLGLVFGLQKTGSRVKLALARDDTVDRLVWSVLGSGACFWVGRLSLYPVLIRVNLCNLRAAEIRSAEATELPVLKRPPVSVANGLCHPYHWIPGQACACPG